MREWLPPERAASAGLTPGPEFPGARNSINSSSKLPVDPVIRYAVLWHAIPHQADLWTNTQILPERAFLRGSGGVPLLSQGLEATRR